MNSDKRPCYTLSLNARSKHSDPGCVYSSFHRYHGWKTRNSFSPIFKQHSVETRGQREVGPSEGSVTMVHHLRLSPYTCKSLNRLQAGSGLLYLGLTNPQQVSLLPDSEGKEEVRSGTASKLSLPGPACEQSTFTTLISPTCTGTRTGKPMFCAAAQRVIVIFKLSNSELALLDILLNI